MAGPFDLTGRTALVTGGSSGIGQAIADGLAAAGADIVLLSDVPSMDESIEMVEKRGRRAEAIVLDLARTSEIEPAVAPLLARTQLDILVNAAGIIRRQPAAEFSAENWQSVLDVNLTAAFTLSKLLGGPMLARGHGKIINIASMLSFQGGALVTSYAASKHGLVGLTKALANEWAARGVQVNAIAPGYITTRTTDPLRADPARDAEILSRIPAGRWGTPQDVSGAAVFLASPAADYVTGHVLAVDGGWLSR
ncbi:2-dehydro-3-deoxy-D-gluconate 5-dehydrogenase KduD [Pseudonocardia sp. TRM90224]|uniref:2-dehydro-3-deoxy-D-gluconate 5-dehydrogenase KduD n=1 Tax=Pseudonocardia sp. TRM90224 TaxID=2812678 RepID=UPI002106F71E|nr:2-dehydro-3-deoxy-D-gluconate 5-dehydrogenase KduD [Pseudonocardia sp. TRM90224]